MSILANYVFFGVMHIPMDCGFWALNFTSALLVIATQALAVFLFSLFPALSIIISIVSMVGSLGATLGGVTFPVPHMFAPVYYASYLFLSVILSRLDRIFFMATMVMRICGAMQPVCCCFLFPLYCCYLI